MGYNQLGSLPETFADIKVDGTLHLNDNHLFNLPESFGRLKVGGDLKLSYNRLVSLPKSFGLVTVGEDLDLSSSIGPVHAEAIRLPYLNVRGVLMYTKGAGAGVGRTCNQDRRARLGPLDIFDSDY